MSVQGALTNLFEHLIVNDDAWVVQMNRASAQQAPYVQGAWQREGFVVEVSNNDVLDPKLTAMQLAALGMHGFTAPSGDEPNFHRGFASTDEARAGAELLATVLMQVLLFGEDDTVEIELFESDLSDVIDTNPDLPLGE